MKFILLIISFSFSLSVWARSGTSIGNGGVGVLCAHSEPKSLQVFDLYEGQALNGYTYIESAEPYMKQVTNYARSLDEVVNIDDSFSFFSLANEINSHLKFLPSGVGLDLTEDTGSFIYPKTCALVQVLNYKIDGFIYVDTDLWQTLSETQKAAFILHETIYKFLRNPLAAGVSVDGDKDSVRTRRAVSLLVAGKNFEKVNQHENRDAGAKSWSCQTKQAIAEGRPRTEFTVFPTEGGTNWIDFKYIQGRYIFSNASIYWEGDFTKIAAVSSIHSLIDWDINVRLYSPSLKYYGLEAFILVDDGIIQTQEKILCTKTVASEIKHSK